MKEVPSSKFKVQRLEAVDETVHAEVCSETLNSGLLVSGLRKTFRDPSGGVIEVLRGVSFGAAAGEAVAVVGASGAGKSTLLHALGGLEAADEGSVRLGDFEITRAGVPSSELARFRNARVGFVFQFHHLLADLTAEENVALPLLVARRKFSEARREAAQMLEVVGLGARASHRAGELSGGERQRVAVARALVTSPRLVLADEPTGNLDTRTGEEVGALMLEACRARGAIAVVATHNEQLARACDRRLRLADGRVRED